MNQTVDTDVSM